MRKLDKTVSVFINEDKEYYYYETILGNVQFKLPKPNIIYSPRYNGGIIPNSIVAKHIMQALDTVD